MPELREQDDPATSTAQGQYSELFREVSDMYGVPEAILDAVGRTESNYNPNAVSPAGAQGLMQIMPATAQQYGITDPFDPRQSVDAAGRYLRDLLQRYDGRMDYALAAYNMGPGLLEDLDYDYSRVPETRDYVARILGDTPAQYVEPEEEQVPPQVMREFMRTAAPELMMQRTVPDATDTFTMLRAMVLSRADEIRRMTPSRPAAGELDAAQRIAIARYEQRRALGARARVNEAQALYQRLSGFAQNNPALAEQMGLSDDWFSRLRRAAMGAGRRGWRVLDVVLRNLDRGRGAIAAYTLTQVEGGTEADARTRAMDALRGSSEGWVAVPQLQAPSFKEVLQAAGMDDDMVTASVGLGLDIAIDPTWLFGAGASRKGVEIATHQILNRAGRERFGRILAEEVRRLGVETQLPLEALVQAEHSARDRMRALVNQGEDVAKLYLDLGGLKLAGYTLPFTASVKREQVTRRGRVEFDYVAHGMAQLYGGRALRAVDRLGEHMVTTASGDLQRRIGEFVQLIPDNIREAGNNINLLFHRTNPRAGAEYRWLKEAEYYERLGYEQLRVVEQTRGMFQGLRVADLRTAPFALEDGPQATVAFLQQLAQTRGPEYAALMDQALTAYRAAMDDILVKLVDRKFMGEQWSDATRKLFLQWVTNPGTMVDPAQLKMFERVRYTNYVPHIYHNTKRAKRLQGVSLKPRAPSITEPFTHPRIFPTLKQAQAAGLVPEVDLAKITAIRLMAAQNALVTHDFLARAAAEHGLNFSGLGRHAASAISLSGMPRPRHAWRDVMAGRTRASGKLAATAQEHLDLARRMALESYVPAEAVARLDEAAIQEFLLVRLRNASSLRVANRAWDKFVEDATRRGLYSGRKLAPAGTREEAFAIAKDLRDPNYVEWATMKVGGLADPAILGKVMLPRAIAEDLARLKLNLLPEEMGKLMLLWDRLNFWWKKSVTVLWPAFHLRNKLTNVVNSAMEIGLGGVLDRGTMWSIMQGGDGVITAANGRKYTYAQIRDAARRYGVVRALYKRADINATIDTIVHDSSATMRGRLARTIGVELPGRQKLIERGQQLGPARISPLEPSNFAAGIENADRMQLFIKSVQRGLPLEQAARRVNQFLFDYDDIGQFDRQVIRRFLMPFWTWSRKNLALQARLVATRPGAFVTPFKFARALSTEPKDGYRSDVERELLPTHLGDLTGIRLEAAQGWSQWLMNIDMPQEELNRLWQGDLRTTMRDWLSTIHPYERDFLEYAFQQDMFRGQRKLDFARGQRVHEIITLAPKPIQNWLGVRKRIERDQEIISVDPKKWRTLMWMTGWSLSRLYSTVGRFADPGTGTISHRLFNLLTGMRFEYVRPEEELRRIAETAVNDKDEGLLTNLRAMWRQAEERTIAQGALHREAMQESSAIREAINTPEEPAELYEDDDPLDDQESRELMPTVGEGVEQ